MSQQQENFKNAIAFMEELTQKNLTEFTEDTVPEYGSDFEGDGFYMGGWRREFKCGTVACIGGWLTLSPALQAAGLSYDYGEPIYEEVSDIDAFIELLGVKREDARYIFYNTLNWSDPIQDSTLAEGLQRMKEVYARTYPDAA